MPAAILVVDDQPDFERLIRQTFRKEVRDDTFAIAFARDGEAALEHLAAHPEVDLVLTDLNMPRLDGLALLDRISALGRPMRVVVAPLPRRNGRASAGQDMERMKSAEPSRGLAYDRESNTCHASPRF